MATQLPAEEAPPHLHPDQCGFAIAGPTQRSQNSKSDTTRLPIENIPPRLPPAEQWCGLTARIVAEIRLAGVSAVTRTPPKSAHRRDEIRKAGDVGHAGLSIGWL